MTDDPVRVLRWSTAEAEQLGAEAPEWLMANGFGGYSCGTVTGPITRRYHGLLIAALPVPLGRTVMLDLLVETLRLADGRSAQLGVRQIATEDANPDHGHLVECPSGGRGGRHRHRAPVGSPAPAEYGGAELAASRRRGRSDTSTAPFRAFPCA
jgi:hypothetical protein